MTEEEAKKMKADLEARRIAEAAAPAAGEDEDLVTLSPFVINTSSDTGYQANNTMSGTRLDSKLEDLGASISVVTKEQLMDFASVDLNDVFAMEVSTEGTHTYSANPGLDARGGDVDNVALNPTTANRVRGLGSANMSIGGTAMTSSIPVDTYNVDSIEISKGANSSIFGVGEVSGTVNLVPSSANLTRNSASVAVSGSSYGTMRGTLDVNRTLVENRLAVRLLTMAENRGFIREPAYDKTRRLTLGLTAKPFKYTTLRLSQEWFDENYSRANTMMPRDYMTLWEQAGRPSWDPTTNVWSYTDTTGTLRTGTQVAHPTTGVTNFPAGVGLRGQGSGHVRPTMFIDDGQSQWFGPTVWNTARTGLPAAELMVFYVPTDRPTFYGYPTGYIPSSNLNVPVLSYQPIKATTDKSFYDYEEHNIAALNRASKSAELTRIQLEQFLLVTKRHLLAAQLSFNRESVEDFSKAFVGNGGDGVSISVLPDVNTKLPDGTENPYYGAPYVGALSPQIYSRPVETETRKVNLAYELDLTRESGWLRFLGKQKLVAYAEQFDRVFSPLAVRYTDQISTTLPASLMAANSSGPGGVNVPWMNLPTSGNFSRDNRAIWNARYYLGKAGSTGISYAPSAPDMSQMINYRRWGNDTGVAGTNVATAAAANSWSDNYLATGETYYTLGLQETELETTGFVWQPMLLNDRIVGTFGIREDTMRVRNGPDTWAESPVEVRDANGLITSSDWLFDFRGQPWLVQDRETGSIENSGRTTNIGGVVKVFPWLHLRYSESDSFKPADYVIDFTGEPLANPNGKTKDYGVRLSFFENRLIVGLTKFETVSLDSRPSAGVAGRAVLIDFDNRIDDANVSNLDLQDWLVGELTKLTPTASPEELVARANEAMGISEEYITKMRSYALGITQNVRSEGYELEVHYNPSRFLTMKLTGSQTEAITSDYAPDFQRHIQERLEVWETIVSPFDNTTRFWDAQQTASNGFFTAHDWFVNLVESPMQIALAQQGQPQPQIRKYRAGLTSSFRLAGLSDNKVLKAMTLGGSLRWEDKGALGIHGAEPVNDPRNPDAGKVFVQSYDLSRPIWDKSHTYLDLFVKYDFRFLENKVRGSLQLNVRNVTESGRLQPVRVNPDATITDYRIIDPREFTLTARFDF